MTPAPHAESAARQHPLVRLAHVNKRYSNGTVALRDMSLDVGEGEFVSLLGPSGCGKSTALRMIAGLLSLSSGEIRWPDRDGGSDTARQDISFVFQEPTLMPWTTVFENVYLPLKLSGVDRAAATPAVKDALALVGLSKFADVYPRELSGGMKMRVSIARAMVTHPKLLLMDEPFAALDEMTRAKLNDDVLRLWQERKLTVMFVTHNVWESVYLSSRIVVMAARPGRVVDDIRIDAPYPRTEAFRTSPLYTEYSVRVSQALRSTLGENDVDH
ncbi:ABC transporter ATP-binding protein [Variovorax terrae]|uniref:ABC transporter ATP-binding protein n=1 Tax=Variovorax terrae TaxID=2923278 RepID=A0A9X2AQ99_9BURK|nr:ABC transporter ATP-binding protein [Variovorax terrae]MCJ0764347.1 ABC transporter ATP-binding protein [Variovorax terrae]